MSISGLNVELDDTLDYIAELDATNIKEACEGEPPTLVAFTGCCCPGLFCSVFSREAMLCARCVRARAQIILA